MDLDTTLQEVQVLLKLNQLRIVLDLNVNETMFMETLEDWVLGPMVLVLGLGWAPTVLVSVLATLVTRSLVLEVMDSI